MYDNTFIIIPSYQPDRDLLVPVIKGLLTTFKNVVVVDDGGQEEYKEIFKEVESLGAIVLIHYINAGKGRAIKTALNYILNNYPNIDAIVTADGDGQHLLEDIIKVADATIKNQTSYILGTRDFSQKQVPMKSSFGNRITRNVFKIFIGLNITDTQTGLRGMSKEVAEELYSVKGERYEYETNALIMCKEKDIPIIEEEIKTVYINDNDSSHFNPIKDSYIIYKLFFKYIFASLSSFLLDILLFTLFLKVYKDNINAAFISTIIARIISSFYNYLINSKLVFKKKNKTSIIKYFMLVIIQMLASATIVNGLAKIYPKYVLIIKIIVDVIIFIVNFVIQREWVFKGE